MSATDQDLARWVEDTTAGHVPGRQILDFLGWLIAGPDRVRAVHADGRLCAVGVVIDTCDSAADCAELNLFVGERAPARVLPELLAWGEAVAMRGPRTQLDVPLHNGAGVRPEALTAAGFAFAYALWGMTASPAPRPPEGDASTLASPLPGFSWREVTPDLLPALHRTTARAFADVPGSFVPPLPMFIERCLTTPASPCLRHVLTDGEMVAAFVRVERRGSTGIVASLGREPALRAHGLGASALGEALRLLAAWGVADAALDVAAVNRDALSLYERHGFRAVTEQQVWRKPLARGVV